MSTYISKVRKSEWINSGTIRNCSEKIFYSRRFILLAKRVPQNTILTKKDELDGLIVLASSLKIDELDTYINGLQAGIDAVKNAICYNYSNGLEERSINKIKLTKLGKNLFVVYCNSINKKILDENTI